MVHSKFLERAALVRGNALIRRDDAVTYREQKDSGRFFLDLSSLIPVPKDRRKQNL